MKTILLAPSELHPGALVPQCLDKHFVSDEVIHLMLRQGREYGDPRVTQLRKADFLLEYRGKLRLLHGCGDAALGFVASELEVVAGRANFSAHRLNRRDAKHTERQGRNQKDERP